MLWNAYRTGQRKSEQGIKSGTINVATFRGKEEELDEVMKMRDLCMLALAEAQLNGNGDRTIHKNYRLMYSGVEDSWYRVGFLASDNLTLYVEKLYCINEQIIGIDLKLKTGVSLLQVYEIQQGTTTVEKEEF